MDLFLSFPQKPAVSRLSGTLFKISHQMFSAILQSLTEISKWEGGEGQSKNNPQEECGFSGTMQCSRVSKATLQSD